MITAVWLTLHFLGLLLLIWRDPGHHHPRHTKGKP